MINGLVQTAFKEFSLKDVDLDYNQLGICDQRIDGSQVEPALSLKTRRSLCFSFRGYPKLAPTDPNRFQKSFSNLFSLNCSVDLAYFVCEVLVAQCSSDPFLEVSTFKVKL
jgi:hypothetical protein